MKNPHYFRTVISGGVAMAKALTTADLESVEGWQETTEEEFFKFCNLKSERESDGETAVGDPDFADACGSSDG